MRKLPDDLQKIACEQLNEVVDRIPDDLQYIKDWLAKQPHISARTDDQWLLSFLRGCKYSLEKTKEKIDFFYTIRGLCPELFNNRDPFLPEIQEVLKSGTFLPLPTPLPTGERVFLLRDRGEKVSITDQFKTSLMITDILLNEDDNFTTAGVISIHDLKKAQLSHIAQAPPDIIKKFMTSNQKAYPLRQKAMHFLYIPSFFHTIMPLFRVFMPEKIQKRMKLYPENDIEKFYEVFPKSVLPQEYGGDAGPLQQIADDWKKKVESYKDWFAEDATHGTNEKKRPGKPKTSDDIFGIDGSFRKLNVD